MVYKGIVQRTITLHLQHDPAIHATVRTFNEATNHFLRIGHEAGTWSKAHLQEAGYYPARAQWPTLQASLVQGARDSAAEALKQCKNKTLPVKQADSAARFNQRTFKPYLETGEISLSTTEGRKRIAIDIPRHFDYCHPGRVVSMRIANTAKGHRVGLVVELPDVPKTIGNRVLGVDRGIYNIAVTSDGEFFNSKHLRHVRGRYRHLRARLQARGTRSAKRKLKRMSGRERRHQANVNHRIAKQVTAKDFDVVALEDLNIKTGRHRGRRMNRLLGGWAHSHLQYVLSYKLESAGKRLVLVNPAYTSQECSRCGSLGSRNGHAFSCACGFQGHSDLNAARNIAHRGIALLGRPSVNGPIVACSDAGAGVSVEHSYKPPTSVGGS